ncbi:MAG TPA: carboxypeptidase regulatory-like domain-containing protein [Terriglobales bacterium]|jgi:hypothetical protein|nr:carboxypeptidase regulatory-like domain-containing protein [Terriglobales bacterium]
MRVSSQLRVIAVLAASGLLLQSPAGLHGQNSNPASNPTPMPVGGFRIAGTVVNAISGHPLARVQVIIADVRNRQNVQAGITSEDGRFEFQVPAGKYALRAAKRLFITASYDQHEQFSTAIVTGAGLDTENLVLRIAPAAVLGGKVIDESGEPVRHAQVWLYQEDHLSGISHIRRSREEATDDQGAYEFSPLDGGTYFVSASAKPWYALHVPSDQSAKGAPPPAVDRSLDVAYPITYYPDTTEADEASPIPVRGGDRIQADIHLNPVPALRLIFHVPGTAQGGFTMPVLQQPAFDGMNTLRPDFVQMTSPGVLEVSGIAAGRYTVSMPSGVNGQTQEPGEMDLTSDGQEVDLSAGEAAGNVKATVHLLGAAALPPQLNVALRNSKRRITQAAPVDDKGEVNFQDVAPGKYDVVAGSAQRAYSVVRISSQGKETSGRALEVGAGASLNLSLRLVGGTATVEGFARRSGKAEAGVMVVLVPKDPESNGDLFRRDQSDLDGSFSLRSVIPGSYTIIAIENAWDMDWAKPAVIAHYCEHGQKLIVKSESNGIMSLTEPVEIQSK